MAIAAAYRTLGGAAGRSLLFRYVTPLLVADPPALPRVAREHILPILAEQSSTQPGQYTALQEAGPFVLVSFICRFLPAGQQ